MEPSEHPEIISAQEACRRLAELPRPWAEGYLAFYSTWLDGIVTEPWLMQVPVDDHLVHRGDGVFEAAKCVAGRIYQLDAHLERMARSAQSVFLDLPMDLGALKRLVVEVARAGGRPDMMVRLYVSRGPGGFTTNPFECPRPGVYIMISALKPPAAEAFERGVRVGISTVPSRSGFFASVKSCNYLPNVLLKREAVVRGWDFAIGLDEDGFVAEGSTENVAMLDPAGRLCLPEPGNILEGTTAKRALELAQGLVGEGLVGDVVRRPISVEELGRASEVMLLGTTLDVLPVTRLGGDPVADGRVGPVARRLLALLQDDIFNNHEKSTPVFA